MKWIKKLALASAAGLICLFVLEMLLRLVTPEHRPPAVACRGQALRLRQPPQFRTDDSLFPYKRGVDGQN
jgi:hypothetical protein